MGITHSATTALIDLADWNAPHVGNSLGYFDVTDYGAVGDGVTDDQPAIQSAIAAAGAAGGGVVYFPKGTYLLTSLAVPTAGSEAHLNTPYSYLHLVGEGDASILKATDAYSILYQGSTTRFVNGTVYPVTASVARGAMSITTATAAHAGNFAAGDYIYIRTGQTIGAGGSGLVGQPDAEINRVVSASAGTGVITLAWPTLKPYAQEYFISTTSGKSSTSVTANPAVFGVTKITSMLVTDQRIENLHFEHTGTGTAYGMIGGQVLRSQIVNVSWRGNTGFQSVGAHRFMTVRDCYLDHPGAAGLYIYTLTADSGCSDTMWINNHITGAHVVSVHIQEGCARTKVIGNTWDTPASVADVNHISVRSRAYDTQILGNMIGYATPSSIVVDPDCNGGGVIMGNQLLGDAGYGVFIAADNWVTDTNRHPYGAKFWGYGVTGIDSERRYFSAWVDKDHQTVKLGVKPANVWVKDVWIHVTTAFNSSGTDTISIGFAADNAGFAAATDVSTTGIKTPTLGGYGGYSPGAHGDINAYYVNGGTEPTTGKALVLMEYVYIPEQP